MDLSKAFIWTSLVLSAAGVGSHFYMKSRLEEAGKNRIQALARLKQISTANQDIDGLLMEKEKDDYNSKGTERYNEYFANMAAKAFLSPAPSVSKPQEDRENERNGYTDKSYELKWNFRRDSNTKGFDRENIASFLWWIENRTKLLKISEIVLENGDPNAPVPVDIWRPKVWVTERRPVASSDE